MLNNPQDTGGLILTLNKFCCWDNITIQVPHGSIVLIKGSSGIGKTTLLKAIAWVLYGKIKKVTPHTDPNCKTKVILHINNSIITRTNNPKKLTYNINNQYYEDNVAQNLINQSFGEHDVWLSTTYVQQGDRNKFLVSPNVNKMELLNKIAFHNQDPTEHIEKIDHNLQKNKTIKECNLITYNKNVITFNNINTIDTDYALSPDEVIEIQNKLIVLKKQDDDISDKLKIRKLSINMKEKLEQELNNLIVQLNNIENIIIPKINYPIFLKTDIISGLEEMDILYDKLKTKLEIENNIDINDNKIYTLEDLQECCQIESIYNENIKFLTSLNLTQDESEILKYITYLNNVIDAQDNIIKKDKLTILQTELKKITIELSTINNNKVYKPIYIAPSADVIDYTIYDTSVLQNKLNNLSLKQGSIQTHLKLANDCKNSIKCPYCDNDVL